MPANEGLPAIPRDDLAGVEGVAERCVFGGVAFMLDGNMVCGVHTRAAMYRVGKPAREAAPALPGVEPMAFTGRPMGGLVAADETAMADDAARLRLRDMALAHAGGLPPE
jgi:hypothetical protein